MKLIRLVKYPFFAVCILLTFIPAQAATGGSYGAVVSDGSNKDLYWMVSENSAEEAKNGALAKCGKAGGKECVHLTSFSNSCIAFSRNNLFNLFSFNSMSSQVASKKVIRDCNKDPKSRDCKIVDTPLCVGPGYSDIDLDLRNKNRFK